MQPVQKVSLQGNLEKLDFDINALDKDGLFGPETGKVSVDYQFCIPSGKEYLDAIHTIDPDIKMMRKYIGRGDCRDGHVAMMGSTHKPMHKEILHQLVGLEFIEKIERVWYLQ
jgi:hypothetical protein